MSSQPGHCYEFDSFRLDPEEHVLLREGKPVPLSPKVFDTLLALVRDSGHIVEKEELIKQVWPDTFVEENNLSQYISVLRRTLGDGRHEQRYIETVPRRGYRFAAGVREVWDGNGDGELVSATHTKVRLAIKEETVEDTETRRHGDTATQGHEKTRDVAASARRRVSVSLALALFVLAASLAVTAFGLFGGDRQQVATESRLTPAVPAAQGFTIKTFDPSVWPRTDAELGVSGFVIEDFEDTVLVQGLRIELSDSTEDFGPTETLPMAFSPDVDDSGGAQVFSPGIWDGSRLFINRRARRLTATRTTHGATLLFTSPAERPHSGSVFMKWISMRNCSSTVFPKPT